MQSLRKNLYLCTLKKRHSILDYYGKTMFYSVRLPGFGRTDSAYNGREAAVKHHRHAPADTLAEAEGDKTGVGARPDRLPHRQSRLLLRAARRSPHALFRPYPGRDTAHRPGNTAEHRHRADNHRTHASGGEQGRRQDAREDTHQETRMT